jgi:hypothetical protein
MSRSEKYLKLSEGFKLGSLGAGRKPVRDVQSLEPLQVQPIKYAPNVTGVTDSGGGSIQIWKENFNPEWDWFFSKDELNGIDLSQPEDIFIYVTYFWDRKNFSTTRKKFMYYYARLTLQIKDQRNRKTSDALFFWTSQPRFEDKKSAVNWMKRNMDHVRQEGLAALLFPGAWERGT